jgi:thiamine biosynthesis lipoprotein ApbE
VAGHDVVQLQVFEALGMEIRVAVAAGDAVVAAAAVSGLLEEIDRTYSRFRSDSELVALNARPEETVHLSPLLSEAIQSAMRGALLTDGLVDPTVGRHLRLLGYDRDFARMRGLFDPIVLRLQPVAGWRAVRFDALRRTIVLPHNVELDLGSTGKAFAADLCAAAALSAAAGVAVDGLQRAGAPGVLVSLGGDIRVAGTPPVGGWNVLIADDSRTPPDAEKAEDTEGTEDTEDAESETISIIDGAIATSSTTVRRWRRGSVQLHHIIDPRTGLPAVTPWRTVSALAATCVDANIAATAALIQGAEAPQWLAEQGLAARLVANDGSVVRVGGWPVPATGRQAAA